MELAVQNLQVDSIVITIRNQMERFAAVNVEPFAVLMTAEQYAQLKDEAAYSTMISNQDEDTVNGLPIVICQGMRAPTVAASPASLRASGLL